MNKTNKKFVLVGVLLLLVSVSAANAQRSVLEYQVKASYLYNFMRFITWPADAFGAGKFNLCVVGAERFGTALNSLIGERVEGHEVVVHRLDSGTQARALRCHVLFLAMGADPAGVGIERGLLTVGETPGFLRHGGIINLVEINGHVRFEINQTAAQKAELTVSSRLLSLAINKP